MFLRSSPDWQTSFVMGGLADNVEVISIISSLHCSRRQKVVNADLNSIKNEIFTVVLIFV